MSIETHPEAERWFKPAQLQEPMETGYEEWLAAEIAEGIAELDDGQSILAGKVWRALDLE